MNALSIRDVSFHYGEKTALDKVTFDIPVGQTVVLLGPNGAGKSTLFSLISGLFSTPEGEIQINGEKVGTSADVLSSLGIVFQSQTLDLDLTVSQNLKYFCSLHGIEKAQASAKIDAALERLELVDKSKVKVRALNGGHRRRVEIARASLHNPNMLLLDEPTVGLDIPTRNKLIEHIHTMAQTNKCAVLWATHLIDEIYPADRVVILHNGRIHADGTCADLLTQYNANGLDDVLEAVMDRQTSGKAS